MEKITFSGYNAFLQPMRSDGSWRVTFDIGLDQYDAVKDLPKLSKEIIWKVTLEPDATEEETF